MGLRRGSASNALQVFVGFLRRKLEDGGARGWCTTCAASATCSGRLRDRRYWRPPARPRGLMLRTRFTFAVALRSPRSRW